MTDLLRRKRNILLSFLVGMMLVAIVSIALHVSSSSRIARSDLFFIREGISFDEVVAHLGTPARDVGSGIYAFEYELEDESILIVGFTALDYLDQAVILEKNGSHINLLSHHIIETPTVE